MTVDINYLKDLDFTEEEVVQMNGTLSKVVLDDITCFKGIININYNMLKSFEISNIKEVFMKHAHMFLLNPDRFETILSKYDPEDLVRCIEKNAAVIEKL